VSALNASCMRARSSCTFRAEVVDDQVPLPRGPPRSSPRFGGECPSTTQAVLPGAEDAGGGRSSNRPDQGFVVHWPPGIPPAARTPPRAASSLMAVCRSVEKAPALRTSITRRDPRGLRPWPGRASSIMVGKQAGAAGCRPRTRSRSSSDLAGRTAGPHRTSRDDDHDVPGADATSLCASGLLTRVACPLRSPFIDAPPPMDAAVPTAIPPDSCHGHFSAPAARLFRRARARRGGRARPPATRGPMPGSPGGSSGFGIAPGQACAPSRKCRSKRSPPGRGPSPGTEVKLA